eukprot:TRINITY_DN5569_c0_g1_i1.p1 TRINITY_DN5569_c0_g1~~TRINITY_DN5569_c0_g1_i1.p1  ORF type:complete len:556 (-),score=92.18 TRINITY_DN5569_c0_g1_i1:17-1684(-)
MSSHKSKYIASVDCGTTGIRAHIWDENSKPVGKSYQKLYMKYGEKGEASLDAIEVFKAFVSVLKDAITNAKIDARDIASLGIATQRSCFLCWDKSTGEPVTPLITWQDHRFSKELEAANNTWRVSALHGIASVLHFLTRSQRFGVVKRFEFSVQQVAVKLSTLWKTEPKLKQLHKEKKLLYGTLDTWILWNVTKGKVHATDVSQVIATGMWDPFAMCWSGILSFLIPFPPMEIFPEVKATSDDFGICDSEFFGHPIPINALVGDQQAAMFGQCCFNKGDVVCTMGTGAFININTGETCISSNYELYPLIAWKIGKKVTYALEGNSSTTGSLLDWAKSIGLVKEVEELESMAQEVRDSNDVYIVPAFAGIEAPRFDSTARGLIIGLTYSTTKAHIARALQEAVAYRVCDVVNSMSLDTNSVVKTINVNGGVCLNSFICQYIADITNAAVERPEVIEMTSLGAAFFAGLYSGYFKDFDHLRRLRRVEKRYSPEMTLNQRKLRIEKWNEATKRCRGWAKSKMFSQRRAITLWIFPIFLAILFGMTWSLLFGQKFPVFT